MPFDLSLLEPDGRPSAFVSFSPNEHQVIFGQASAARYKLIPRLCDYYRDADFEPRELVALRDEFKTRADEIEIDSLSEKLKLAVALLTQAIEKGKGVTAIVD
jgi:hypothetical protein